MEFICKFCGKECKNANSLRNHERTCPKNPDRNYVSHTIGLKAWNKGLTKETDERVRKYGETTSILYKGTEEGLKHDEIRTEILLEEGWVCAKRIRWSNFQKLTKTEKEEFIKNLPRVSGTDIPFEAHNL